MKIDSWESINEGPAAVSWAHGLDRWYKNAQIMNWEGQLSKKVLEETLHAHMTMCNLSANTWIFSHKHQARGRYKPLRSVYPWAEKAHKEEDIISSRVTHAESTIGLHSHLHPHQVWFTRHLYDTVTLTCKRLTLTYATSENSLCWQRPLATPSVIRSKCITLVQQKFQGR